MNNRLLTEEEKQIIVKFYNSGMKISKIKLLVKRCQASIIKTLRAANVIIRDRNSESRKYFFDFNYFKKIDTEEKAYFLGLLYADGYIQNKLGFRHVFLALQEEDKDILEKFRASIRYSGELQYIKRRKPRKNMFKLTLSSQIIVNDLDKIGCRNQKSLNLIFPDASQVPKYLIRHFIRGYFDGDGGICFTKQERIIITITSTLDFNTKLDCFIRDECGIIGKINKHQTTKENVYIYNLFKMIDTMKFLKWIYKDATVYMDRKMNKFLECKEKLITNVEAKISKNKFDEMFLQELTSV